MFNAYVFDPRARAYILVPQLVAFGILGHCVPLARRNIQKLEQKWERNQEHLSSSRTHCDASDKNGIFRWGSSPEPWDGRGLRPHGGSMLPNPSR